MGYDSDIDYNNSHKDTIILRAEEICEDGAENFLTDEQWSRIIEAHLGDVKDFLEQEGLVYKHIVEILTMEEEE